MKRIRPILAGLLAALLWTGCAAPVPDSAPAAGEASGEAENTAVQQHTSVFSHFIDVPKGIWYEDATSWCRENGIMYGTSETQFSPAVLLSRAMLTMVLYQEAGSPAVSGPPAYTDVSGSAWYAPSIIWCTENESVNGYGGGLFGPEDPLTREQIVAVLWRYSGCPEEQTDANFSDGADISAYAQDAVHWARANGIVMGVGENRFEPKGYVTRAQAAVIFQRYFQWRRGMSVVFMSSGVSPDALVAVYQALYWRPSGQMAVKISTGELSANSLRPELTGELIRLLGVPVVECN
ncbi:MAG: S-layer homology domain-containing protein, partial [Oscillospiraceae bacterium]|nr:S-layer homology domain-containing protein [Oscillospiraceae bacterium]